MKGAEAPSYFMLTELTLKGGFAYLILQNLAVGLRTIFTRRSADVALARTLLTEVRQTLERIHQFSETVPRLVEENRGKDPATHRFSPEYKEPLITAYQKHADGALALLTAHSQEAVDSLFKYLHCVDGYKLAIAAHRKYFIEPSALRINQDPHIRLEQMASWFHLGQTKSVALPMTEALDAVIAGNKFWAAIRKKWLYRPIKVVMAGLLIFLPPRDSL